jgi:type VI secretion system protein VasD
MKRFRRALALLVWVTGCGSAPPPPPAAPPKPCPPIAPTLAITATTEANAVASGEGRPLQVRIYQLKSDARLRAASFEDVWQNDAKVLEGELVSVEEQTIFPGKTVQVSVTPKPDAHYLALVGLFREPKGKDWLLSYELAGPPSAPPCPTKPASIPVWIDRMQIQDGTGRETDNGSGPAGPAGTP